MVSLAYVIGNSDSRRSFLITVPLTDDQTYLVSLSKASIPVISIEIVVP